MSRISKLQKKFEKLYIDAFLVTDQKKHLLSNRI